jgi:6-pyruvoyltetrahydropterin/6-carboxytetrahydropterin synthase
MYEIEKAFPFEAGHVLKNNDGKCGVPHGHSFIIFVKIQAGQLIDSGPQKNMIIDHHEISKIVNPMIESYFDHKWLNDTLKTEAPTIEFIAKWVYDYLAPSLPYLYQITVQETAKCKASYTPKQLT